MSAQALLSAGEKQALDDFVRALYAQHSPHVLSVTLFGSKARGDAGTDSDLDLLVVLTDKDWRLRRAVRRLAARISLKCDVLLSVRAIGQEQWAELARYRFPLYKAIQAEGIDLTPAPCTA